MQPRLRVLFTTPVLEYPPAGGPQLRIANSIKALARVCELDVVYRCAGRNGLEYSALLILCLLAIAHDSWRSRRGVPS